MRHRGAIYIENEAWKGEKSVEFESGIGVTVNDVSNAVATSHRGAVCPRRHYIFNQSDSNVLKFKCSGKRTPELLLCLILAKIKFFVIGDTENLL